MNKDFSYAAYLGERWMELTVDTLSYVRLMKAQRHTEQEVRDILILNGLPKTLVDSCLSEVFNSK